MIHWKQRDWRGLESKAVWLHNKILSEWCELIDNKRTNEQMCLKFVRDHAGLFFHKHSKTPITISELSLGSDYKIDFVTVTENFSAGTTYKLIEFESPNSKLYRKDGKTTARLSGAIDQILEWRRWISQHRTQAQKIFPSVRWRFNAEPTFSYQIVIGRRGETMNVQDKIWSRIHTQSIEVISYDRLTDHLCTPYFCNQYWAGMSAEGRRYLDQKELLNLAACPFTKAISDGAWRKATSENPNEFSSHLTPPYLDNLVSEKFINDERLNQFDLLMK